jgi:hypothetical protein
MKFAIFTKALNCRHLMSLSFPVQIYRTGFSPRTTIYLLGIVHFYSWMRDNLSLGERGS